MAIFPEASNNDLNAFLLIEGNSLCKQDVPGWWWPKAPTYLVMFFLFFFFCFANSACLFDDHYRARHVDFIVSVMEGPAPFIQRLSGDLV